ncbi:MAG: hypothetical protein BMS9Abin30_0366 [Gammaproteobacteria bacterium]|nr:MAG: hypothetical protein BMS9Abin30_0366 [Gammaproteobacteria bacterium]
MKNLAYVIVAPDLKNVTPDLIRGPVFFLTLHQQQDGFRIKACAGPDPVSGMTDGTYELL